MTTPTPRRMKANPGTNWYHAAKHDETEGCKKFGCLPVDAPVTEPRNCQHDFDGVDGGECRICHKSVQDLMREKPTPPPASAPVTPVERWLTWEEITWGYYGSADEASCNECRKTIERLCALLDEKEKQRHRADELALEVTGMQRENSRLTARCIQAEADLAAAQGRKRKLRGVIAAVRPAISEKHDLCKAFDAALAATNG